jgi:methionyl-tRNA formyltransferase
MVETLRRLQAHDIQPRLQDNAHASRAPILKKEDGLIDFSRSATEILNRLRGFQPWPGAYTKFRGKTLQILKALPTAKAFQPAELHILENRLLVGCGDGSSLDLLELQLEGKKRTTDQDFLHGYRPRPGEKLGE